MPKEIFRLVIFLLAVFLTPSVGTSRADSSSVVEITESERAWMDQNPDKLVLWFNTEFPPIEFVSDAGDFAGMGADIASMVEEKLGISFVKRASDDWNEHLAALESGACAVAPTIVATPERERYVWFTSPYATAPVVIIAGNGSPGGLELADLAGMRVAVVSGYATEGYLRECDDIGVEVAPMPDVVHGLRAVSFGQVDAFVENLAVAAYYIDKEGISNLRVVGSTPYSFAWSIGVGRQYPLLFSAVQKALASIPGEQLEAVRRKWISLEINDDLSSEKLHLLLAVVVFSTLLALGLLGVSDVLRRRMNQSEAKFRAIVSNAPIPLAIVSLDGTISEVNDCFTDLFGYTVEDIPDMDRWWQLAYPEPDRRGRAKSAWQSAVRLAIDSNAKVGPAEASVTCKDGRVRRAVVVANAIGNAIIVSLFEITELREKEAALQESMELLRATFNATSDGILVVDEDLKITQANRQFYEMWQVPPDLRKADEEAALRKFVMEQLQDPAGFRDRVDALYSSRRQDMFELLFKDGRVFECYTAPVVMSGKETGRVWDLRDISERKKVEEAIDFERRQLLSIFDNLYEIIYVSDPVTYEMIFANRRLRDLLDKEPTDEMCYQVLQGFDRPCPFCTNHIILDNDRQAYRWEYHNPLSHMDVDIVDQLIRWPDGRDVRLEIAVDVTEQKRAKEALRKSEKQLRSIFAAMTHVVLVFDAQCRLVEFAATNTELLPPREHLGKSFAEIFPPEIADVFSETVRNVLSRKESLSLDYELAIDGRQVWFAADVSPLSADQVIWVARDITSRKQAEEQLRLSEEKFSKVFAMAPDVITVSSLEDGMLVDVNNGFEEITGWKRSEAVGLKSVSDLNLWVDPCERAFMVEELREGRDVLHRELEFRRKDGEERLGLYSARAIRVSDEWTLIFVMQDITETRKLEADSRKLRDQLLHAQKMEAVGTLAGGVAHDFNNMLGAIMGYAELTWGKMDADHPLRKNIGRILDAAGRSAALTRQLLAFARKQAIAPEVFDINDAVEELLKMLRRLIGEHIDLEWLPKTRPCNVKLDPSQIDQILANLCVNARDAIGDVGRVTIETDVANLDEAACSPHPGCDPGEYVVLSVSDSGCGMDKDTVERIFEPFFTTKPVGQGTGLGLATVYGIVQQNGGFIGVYSEPGEGTTFMVYFPRYAAEVRADRKTSRDIACSQGETVLLVEDDPMLLEMGASMLETLGYSVLSAQWPTKAIVLAQDSGNEIDMLLTDVVMPEMTGRELADRLKNIRPEIKHLFMSGYTADVIARQGVLDEKAHFIQKPFSLRDLAVKMREILDEG